MKIVIFLSKISSATTKSASMFNKMDKSPSKKKKI